MVLAIGEDIAIIASMAVNVIGIVVIVNIVIVDVVTVEIILNLTTNVVLVMGLGLGLDLILVYILVYIVTLAYFVNISQFILNRGLNLNLLVLVLVRSLALYGLLLRKRTSPFVLAAIHTSQGLVVGGSDLTLDSLHTAVLTALERALARLVVRVERGENEHEDG